MTAPYVITVPASATPTSGTLLFYGATTATTAPATRLGNIKKYGNLPGLKGKMMPTTRIDQVLTGGGADVYEHQAPGLRIKADPLKLTVGFKASDYATNLALIQVMKSWLIQFSDGSGEAFNGCLNEITKTAQEGDEITCEITIEIDGGLYPQAAPV